MGVGAYAPRGRDGNNHSVGWAARLSYTYLNGSAEAGPIGPADWTVIAALERDGKVSFANQNIRKRFLKLRGLSGRDH
jgi:hypothetical protein